MLKVAKCAAIESTRYHAAVGLLSRPLGKKIIEKLYRHHLYQQNS